MEKHATDNIEDAPTPHAAADIALHEERSVGAWQALLEHKRITLWCIFFAFAAIGWGFDAQVNGAMISVPQFRLVFGYGFEIDGQPVLPASWTSGFSSISSVGQFFGGLLCSLLSDRLGRRASLFIGLLFVCGGIFGEVFSHTRAAFLIGKLILGVGLGFYLTIAPLYTSELAPVAIRGIVTAGINFAIVIGQLLSNGAIAGFGTRTDDWAFRGPFAIQWVFVAILLVGLPWAPESPWYHVRKGNTEAARRSLRQLYGPSVDINPRLAAIQKTVDDEQEVTRATRWIHCFQGTDLLRTMISTGVFICQHLSGIVFVLGFSTYFFELAGIATSSAFDLGVGVTACGVVGVVISWSLVNTFGRRNLFLVGMAGLTTVLFLIGICDVIPTGGARWAEASFTVVYALVYQATIGCIAFSILGETSSSVLRAKTVGLATAVQAIAGTVMNVVVPYMVNPDKADLKGKVGFVFGGASLLATIWTYFYVPELKGRTFDEIDYMFKHHVDPRKMGSFEFRTQTSEGIEGKEAE